MNNTGTEQPARKKVPPMLIPTLIMAVLAAVLLTITYSRGDGSHITGLAASWKLILMTLPMIIFALIVAGLIQVLLPPDLISRWVGVESGFRGIIIGTLAGAVTPGGPYVSLPVVAGLLNAGASTGTMVAFLTSWSLWAVARLPMEFGILGWRFTVIRVISVLIFPPIAGIIANVVTKMFRWSI